MCDPDKGFEWFSLIDPRNICQHVSIIIWGTITAPSVKGIASTALKNYQNKIQTF